MEVPTMMPLRPGVDWRAWFERWQAQQDCYVPQRLYRFNLMLRWPGLPQEAEVHILDFGCGPGSLAFRAVACYPRAHVVAVDFDPVLLAMGQRVAQDRTDRIEFLQADVRDVGWWIPYDGRFDLIVSATALHWLNAENLVRTYRRVYQALRPGGWLMISDHMASDNRETQSRYRELLRAKQQEAFRASAAHDWDAFWEGLGRELGQSSLRELRHEAEYWEGSDDGQPKRLHIDVLRECGFEQVQCHWQDLGEAVIGARKTPVGNRRPAPAR
jgi:SAM-dependent methyltransferase